MASATFAMGCFWKPETIFRGIEGVTDARVGHAGGHVVDSTYRQVCRGDTGHAEVVQVDFDSERVSYDALLEVFWDHHDPTTRDRQGPDVGRQYRSAVFAHDAAQQEAAEASLKVQQALQKTGAVCY